MTQKLKLTFITSDTDTIPSSLLALAEDKEAFTKAYHEVGHVTDVIKEEILNRINKELFPNKKELQGSGAGEEMLRKSIRIQVLKDVLDILP